MKNPVIRTLVVASLASLASLGVAATAFAAWAEPGNCTLKPVTNGAQASCTSGTGLVRAGVDCIAKNEFDTTHYGPWVPVGGVSTARCFGGSRIVDSWYDLA